MPAYTCTALPGQSYVTFAELRAAWEAAGKPAAPVDHTLSATPWVFTDGAKRTSFGCSQDPPCPVEGPSIYPHARATRLGWRT